MKIEIKNSTDLIVPTRGTPKSAGYDIVANSEPEIVGTKFIPIPGGEGDYWKQIDYIQYRTGLFIAPKPDQYQNDYHTLLFPRSSVSKYNLALANCIGLIDNDYRGEILLRFKYMWQPEDFSILLDHNMTFGRESMDRINDNLSRFKFDVVGRVNVNKIYKKGDKIGQLVAEVTNVIDFIAVDILSSTTRGEGGFGSTNTINIDAIKAANDPMKHFAITESRVVPEMIPITNREVETPKASKNYESKVDILEKWKTTSVASKANVNYETLIREREKSI